jgi:hypothetical protein
LAIKSQNARPMRALMDTAAKAVAHCGGSHPWLPVSAASLPRGLLEPGMGCTPHWHAGSVTATAGVVLGRMRLRPPGPTPAHPSIQIASSETPQTPPSSDCLGHPELLRYWSGIIPVLLRYLRGAPPLSNSETHLHSQLSLSSCNRYPQIPCRLFTKHRPPTTTSSADLSAEAASHCSRKNFSSQVQLLVLRCSEQNGGCWLTHSSVRSAMSIAETVLA